MDIAKIESLLNMQLHEVDKINENLYVTRVVGGWLYESVNEQNVSSSFIPEKDNLFIPQGACHVYGHRFEQLTKADTAVKVLNKIDLNDNNPHFLCSKCGELVKSI